MEPALNPFRPGSGRKPPALAGRDDDVAAFDLLVARSRRNDIDRSIMLHGLRGVGKTVLLNAFADHAERAGWLVCRLEGSPATSGGSDSTRHRLARQLTIAGRSFGRRGKKSKAVINALKSIHSFSFGILGVSIAIGVDPVKNRAATGRIEFDLEEVIDDLGPALAESHTTLGIFIDEMQDVDPDLTSALLTAQHLAHQRSWPIYIIGAGLPSLPSVLSTARTYAERLFAYRSIGPLDHAAATTALVQPITSHGGMISVDATELLVTATAGYPYFVQAYGSAVWNAADNRHIDIDDARVAIEIADLELDEGFYPSRWDRASPLERSYLRGMAEDGDAGSLTREVAARLKLPPSGTSPARASLIEKGIIFAPERGRVAFAVPGMARYIARRNDD